MDILQLAEQNFLITFAVVTGIGLLQGAIIARGIRNRFPSLKIHARAVSILLLVLFSINAITNVMKFAEPTKLTFTDLVMPTTIEEVLSLFVNILGLNAGLGAVVTMFVSVTLVLLFRFANLNKVARYFVFSISTIVLVIALVAKFTDFVPTTFQIVSYSFYQFGITAGLFLVTRRKEIDPLEVK